MNDGGDGAGGRNPRFTILLPVVRPPDLLPFAIASVQAQRRQDWELLVVCDGAPAATAECARTYALVDPRVRVFEFEKGERYGEAHRHTALHTARGKFVAQIADDDQWFPNHLIQLERLLRTCDFGHVWQANVLPNGRVWVGEGDLGTGEGRRSLFTNDWSFFGPTVAGYRLQAYRSLPSGWSPAPPELSSDVFMWRKFLAAPGVRCETRRAITALHISSAARSDMSIDVRRRETERWAARLRRPWWRTTLVVRVRSRMWLSAHVPPAVIRTAKRIRDRVE